MASPEHPKVTVLMPVYNAEEFLDEAIRSILNQTLCDFEFLIIDDGSTDRSVEIMGSYRDPRIRLVRNERNLGVIDTLNRGLDLARGKYIARMDADDVSLPNRLEKQVAFMEAHPEIGVCGTWAKVIDGHGTVVSELRAPLGKAARRLCWRPSPFIHPSCLLLSTLLKEERYRSKYPHTEDYDLWLRLSKKTGFGNIGEFLLLYRTHSSNIGKLRRKEQLLNSFAVFSDFFAIKKIDYSGFLALVPAVASVNPLRRAYYWLLASRHTGLRLDEFLIDNLIYIKLWLTGYDEQSPS